MELEIEMKPATPSNETEGACPASNASHSSPVNDRRSPGRNSPEKRRREEEDKSPSLEESDSLREGGRASLHPMWKTSLCSFFRRSPGGVCRHGGACRYAHGEMELRSRPDNSWDPTSDKAKKMLKTSAGDAAAGEAEEEEDAAVDLTCLDKCLVGLPKKWASDNFKSFLDGQGISYKTAKTKKGMAVGFVSFENAEQIKSAIEVLKENTANGKHIKVADAIRRSQDSSDFGPSSVIGTVTKVKTVRDVVTPLAHMSYSDQLEHKKNSLLQTLKRLTRNARKACPDAAPLPDWILKSREIGGLPCKLEGILESPLVDGYRNKCEFSVGCSSEGKRTVGFMLGNFREGVTAVEEPASCSNVSRISCKYALIFQDFLQYSEFPVWNRIDNTGFWRQFTVREGRSPGQVTLNGSVGVEIAEVMLIVQVCSLGYEEEHMRREFNRMTHALAHGAAACSPPAPLTAIIVQDHRGISNAAPADCPLILLELPKVDGLGGSGVTVTTEARIHDYISNLRFSISPTAFFQVNTLAAERLYSLAGDWAELSPDTLLFDICCGTGTIGLTLAHRVGMVVGIEMNESAVSDATRNAEINGIKNCRFICGKAEDVMGAILKEYLDVPGNHGEVSDDLRSNGVYIVGNGTDKIVIAEDLHDDTGAATDVSPRTVEEMLPYSEERTMDKLADYTERNNVDGNSEQLIGDSDDLAGFPGTHMAECTSTTSTSDENGKCSHTSKESFEFGNQSQENILLKQSTATNAATVHQFKKVVAIVDPPRVGLHPIVIKALRTHPRIRQLVYISCNPETLVANAIELCTPTADKQEKAKGNRGWRNMSNAGLARHRVKSMPVSEPFNPVRAMAVDLFPHTPHCEMVMLLER